MRIAMPSSLIGANDMNSLGKPAESSQAAGLFLSYDGLTDPLGRSQILPYLVGLSDLGHRMTVISCEKPEAFARGRAHVGRICRHSGIAWHPLAYHKRPPMLSTAWDMVRMTRLAKKLHERDPFDVLHCRSYIPAVTGLRLKRRFGTRFLFDMRGFWPDERADGGNWNLDRPLYRRAYNHFKRLESAFLRESDHIISLTDAGKEHLLTRPELRGEAKRITVIPCCVDFAHFALPSPEQKAEARRRLEIAPDRKVLCYLGSLGGNYMLGELLDFFVAYRERHADALFLFVTRDAPGPITAAAAAKGIAAEDLIVRPATREEVPLFVSAANLGVAFKQPVFSSKGCSPTKLGEMLALGIPMVANAGVGDVEEVLRDTGSGVAIDSFSQEAYARAIQTAEELSPPPEEIRRRALAWFDVKTGIGAYNSVYCTLRASGASAPSRNNPA